VADANLSSSTWSVADLLRGDYKQPEYGKVILPFTVLRRLKSELLNAIMGTLDAHNLMSTQALNSEKVRDGLLEILLDHSGLWENLRTKGAA
jgi:type I restriction-modification system DNA methylase subunit